MADLFDFHVLQPSFVKRDPHLAFEKSFPLPRRRQVAADPLHRYFVRLALVQVRDGRFVHLREEDGLTRAIFNDQ